MHKFRLTILLIILFSTQTFAEMHEGKSCGIIAKACSKAGYVRQHNAEKKFWLDCMKPVVLGQTVKGIDIDSAIVKECREKKIEKMKKELSELEKVS